MTDLVARLRLEGNASDLVAASKAGGSAMRELKGEAIGAKGGLEQAAAGARTFSTETRGADLAARGLATAIGVVGLREMAAGLKDAAFRSNGFQMGMEAATGSASVARRELSFIRDEALRLGLNVRTSTEAFNGLAGATKGSALEGGKTREIWLGVAEAGLAAGRSSEEVGRALTAVQQIAAKGVVSMEEVRGQLSEAIPSAGRLAAEAMGMTQAEFGKLVESGNLLATDFLPKFAKALREDVADALERNLASPIGQARVKLESLETAMYDLQAIGGDGFLAGLLEGVSDLNRSLTEEETRAAVRELGHDLGQLVGIGAKGLGLLAENADLVKTALIGLAALKFAPPIVAGFAATRAAILAAVAAREADAVAAVAQARAMGTVNGVMVTGLARTAALTAAKLELAAATTAVGRAATVGRAALGGLSAFLGGPLGIALLAATGLAYGLSAAIKSANDASPQAMATGDALRKAAEDYEKAALAASSASDQAREAALNEAAALRTKEQQLRNTAQAELALARATLARVKAEGRSIDDNPVLSAEAGGAVNFRQGLREDRAAADVRQREKDLADVDRRIAEADAVLNAKPPPIAPASPTGKPAKKTPAQREAERYADRVGDMKIALDHESAALDRRSEAMARGEAALEELRVKEAGVDVLRQLGVASVEKLTGAQRTQTERLMELAEATERKVIADEKAERVRQSADDLDRETRSLEQHIGAVSAGADAEARYAEAEFVRQEVERAGKTLTADQVALLTAKAQTLFRLQAAAKAADNTKALDEELKLLRMTSRERELEIRFLEHRQLLLEQGIGLIEAEAEARRKAALDLAREDQARTIGDLKEDLRRAFIEGGELAFDEIGDYAERKLREAIYNALLAKPIDIIVNATVKGLDQALGQIFGGGSAGGGMAGIAQLMGMKLPAGMGTLGGVLGNGATGMVLGQALGIKGSGNGMIDFAASSLGGMAGTALGGMAATAIGGSMGAMVGSVLGPIGAIAGMALGGLINDKERPLAVAEVVARNGSFKLEDNAAVDGGPGSEINKMAKAIADSLNNAAAAFGIDVSKVEGLYTTAGYVTGERNFYGLGGKGYFGGLQNGSPSVYTNQGDILKKGAQYTREQDAEELATKVVRDTIIRALEAGASDLSAAEIDTIKASADFEAAANKIAMGRQLGKTIDDAILKLTDPAAFERKAALDAVETSYKALKSQAEELIKAALAPASTLQKLEQLRDMEIADALKRLGDAAGTAASALEGAKPRMKEWLDSVALTQAAERNPFDARQLAQAQYERMLEKARAGDPDAINGLTGAADRLLSADREATSSAQSRLALYAKVTGDVAALAGVTIEDPTTKAVRDLIAATGVSADKIIASLGSNGKATVNKLAEVLLMSDRGRAAILLMSDKNAEITLSAAGTIVRSADLNNDGVLSASELERSAIFGLTKDNKDVTFAAAREAIDRADLNADGLLDQTELMTAGIAGLTSRVDSVTVRAADRLIASFDTNLDGLLSAAELEIAGISGLNLSNKDVTQAAALSVIRSADANRDGLLQASELERAGIYGLAQNNSAVTLDAARSIMQNADSNRDGILSAEELQRAAIAGLNNSNRDVTVAAAQSIVSAADTNADGLYTIEELQKQGILGLTGKNTEVTLAAARGVVAALDANMDGLVSATELQLGATRQGYLALLQVLADNGDAAAAAQAEAERQAAAQLAADQARLEAERIAREAAAQQAAQIAQQQQIQDHGALSGLVNAAETAVREILAANLHMSPSDPSLDTSGVRVEAEWLISMMQAAGNNTAQIMQKFNELIAEMRQSNDYTRIYQARIGI